MYKKEAMPNEHIKTPIKYARKKILPKPYISLLFHTLKIFNKIKLKTIFVHIVIIYICPIYSHVMYKNELNQQNKGDETNEKICIPKPFITTYTL